MNLEKLLAQLEQQQVQLWVEDDQLRYRAPQGALTEGLRNALIRQKSEVIAQLQHRLPQLIPAPAERYQPFVLNDIQQAYWLGRGGNFEIGNVSTHVYLEIDGQNLDLQRLHLAWSKVIERHDMLRVIICPNGQQQILETVPPYEMAILDLRSQRKEAVAPQLAALRSRMSHQVCKPEQWPLFEMCATRLDECTTRLHLSIDGLIADGHSLFLLFQDWAEWYQNPALSKPALPLSFRDYVLAETALQESSATQAALAYWRDRLPHLPPAPELPLARNPGALTQPRFVRYSDRLDPNTWDRLKAQAKPKGLTPSGVLLAAYAQVLATWSKSLQFTLNVTLSNRLSLHPQVNDLAGVFSSINLLEVDYSPADTFADRALRLQRQLWQDLDHHTLSGIRVLRELAALRQTGASAQMPVVFTSTLLDLSQMGWMGEIVYWITQTPQVWLDCQVYEQHGSLLLSWDVVEDLFPAGLISDMFGAYQTLLRQLADCPETWQQSHLSLLVPEQHPQSAGRQFEELHRHYTRPLNPPILGDFEDQNPPELGGWGANAGMSETFQTASEIDATEASVPDKLLHNLFNHRANQQPDAIAIIAGNLTITYAELRRQSHRIGYWLRQRGARPNQLVAVVMEKGWEQIAAVLGILQSGAAYLPIDPALPLARLHYLLNDGEVSLILTQSHLRDKLGLPESFQCLCVDVDTLKEMPDLILASIQTPDDLAYVIYTSGSTGTPKGVMIAHRGAVNAIAATNQHFEVSAADRVLGLTALHHDMSVYDIFGTLAAGGTIILPDAASQRDPVHWLELIQRHQITIWNSVPAMMEMLLESISGRELQNQSGLGSLRLAFLGGDWIPLSLPERLQSLAETVQIVSVGGPTETTLWNIWYPVEQVDPTWNSIPYGRAIANARYYVLNEKLEPCPVWVAGQLYCAGVGLAKGYWRDPEKTNARFIHHPQTGERLYQTGDLGRYLPDGNLEFLGRQDFQIKLNGFRIEPGEIEAVLCKHSLVQSAVVVAASQAEGQRSLTAYIIPKDRALFNDQEEGEAIANGWEQEFRQSLSHQLPSPMVPSRFVLLDRLPLTVNGKVDRQALAQSYSPLPETENASTAPRNSTETQLAAIWEDLLGLDQIGIHLNFFHLGGNSLLAVQLANRIAAAFQIELPLNRLFEAPTIAALSLLLNQSQGASGMPSAELDLAAEAVLDDEIQLKADAICPITQPQAIFLTGATGYLGTFLLHELLHQTQAKIYCLVRSNTIAAGKARLQQAALSFNALWDEAWRDRIIPVLGDLSQPLLGLTQAQFETLATCIDCIYHSGAQVNFTYPYEALKATNVLGTQEVLRLAVQQKTKPVHFVSTTHVFSADHNAAAQTIWETLSPDLVADLPTGYAQSKWVAEQLMAIARSRGFPISIYRPSLIVGHQQTGAGNAQDLMFRMIKGCFQLGIAPDLDLSFNIVPVDYVSGAIVHLSAKSESLGNTFHMVNPHHIAIQWQQILQWLEELNYDLPTINYLQWLSALQCHCEEVTDNALHPLLPVFLSIGNNPSTALLSHETLFDCQNTLAGLADTPLTCPIVDRHWLSKYLSFFGDHLDLSAIYTFAGLQYCSVKSIHPCISPPDPPILGGESQKLGSFPPRVGGPGGPV